MKFQTFTKISVFQVDRYYGKIETFEKVNYSL